MTYFETRWQTFKTSRGNFKTNLLNFEADLDGHGFWMDLDLDGPVSGRTWIWVSLELSELEWSGVDWN